MNLNSLKKGHHGTNPERGLHRLPGAQGSSKLRDKKSSIPAIRVSGKYIRKDQKALSKSLGIISFAIALVAAAVMVFFSSSAALKNHDAIAASLPSFVLGFIFIHGILVFVDGLSDPDTCWVRRSVKLFWMGVCLSFLMGLVL
ncbi:MAG: hypothetical protein ACSHX0_08195 [Akkermansiaceae bacterium]